MKWQIWVEPNQIFVEEFPNGWTHDDVRRAAENRYPGKVQTVGCAPTGGSSDDDDDNGGGSFTPDLDLGTSFTLCLVLGGIILFFYALPFIIVFGAIGLIGWGCYKFIKWILK